MELEFDTRNFRVPSKLPRPFYTFARPHVRRPNSLKVTSSKFFTFSEAAQQVKRVLKMEREDKKLESFTQPFPGVVSQPETQDKRHHCASALDALLASLPLSCAC